MNENQVRVSSCPFCNLASRLGKEDDAGVIEVMGEEPMDLPSADMGMNYILQYQMREGRQEVRTYSCGIGEEGKDCIIPKLYRQMRISQRIQGF